MGDLFVDDNNTIDDDGVDDFDGKSVVLDTSIRKKFVILQAIGIT